MKLSLQILSRYRILRDSRHQAHLLLALVAGLMVVFTLAGAASLLSSQPGELAATRAVSDNDIPQDNLIYDRGDQVLLADLATPDGSRRYHVSLNQEGKWLPMATVAIEDSSFWNEGGINPAAILRAALIDISNHRIVQGGSTIVQQLVKQRVTGDSTTIWRKLREAVIATQINGTTSKQKILEMYLNIVFYGNNAYGGQAAAQTFFHVDANKLDLAQAALLAGLPQGPNANNPLLHWSTAKQRQREVLDAMVRAHNISSHDADQAYAEDLSPPQHMFSGQSPSLAPGFTQWVTDQLVARVGQKAVNQGGLRVTTSLDWNLQQQAMQAISTTVAAQRFRNLTDGALVSIDPHSGDVLAMVGSAGPGTPGGEINLAITPRNPGSTFKLFTYTAAIASKKYTMVTPIQDAQLTVTLPHETYQPSNDDHRYHGTCQLQQCLGNSLNIPAVEVEMTVGLPKVVEEARAMGAPPYSRQGNGYTDQADSSSFGPALTLGGYPETVLRMATGASVLAGQGVLHPPRGILRIKHTGMGGESNFDNPGNGIVDPGTAFIVSQMLANNANRTMIFGANSPLTISGRTVAAKTGTTDDFRDGWTVGYTPSLATAVWMGNANAAPMINQTDGVTVAAPAWHQFMVNALNSLDKGDEWYSPPSDVHQEIVDGATAWFLDQTSARTPAPKLPDNVKLATPANDDLFPPGEIPQWLCQGFLSFLCAGR